MFGCLVAGRLLQTNLVQIDETQGMFSIPNPESINHLCIFLLGTVPFPDGYGATVHLHMPGKGFQVLGMISNDKPSAIFRLKNAGYSTQNTSNIHTMSSASDSDAIIGLSIEPLEAVYANVAHLQNPAAPGAGSMVLSLSTSGNSSAIAQDPTTLAKKIVENLINFLSSFEATNGGVFIRLADLTRWYEKFMAKLQNSGLSFLDAA
ncbi:DUF775-domain-containing protein [Clavulina sp. PMI_390]|nr:DUF775-domain-containing protein [Clavulina sp. PMI_390]